MQKLKLRTSSGGIITLQSNNGRRLCFLVGGGRVLGLFSSNIMVPCYSFIDVTAIAKKNLHLHYLDNNTQQSDFLGGYSIEN